MRWTGARIWCTTTALMHWCAADPVPSSVFQTVWLLTAYGRWAAALTRWETRRLFLTFGFGCGRKACELKGPASTTQNSSKRPKCFGESLALAHIFSETRSIKPTIVIYKISIRRYHRRFRSEHSKEGKFCLRSWIQQLHLNCLQAKSCSFV